MAIIDDFAREYRDRLKTSLKDEQYSPLMRLRNYFELKIADAPMAVRSVIWLKDYRVKMNYFAIASIKYSLSGNSILFNLLIEQRST